MNSKSRREIVTLYLDRNLGSKVVPSILREKSIPCEIHDDHLPYDAPDEAWVRLCSDKNWVAITKDIRLKYNDYIKEAIRASSVGIFVISAKNLTGDQLGQLIANCYKKISRHSIGRRRPFLATLSLKGHVSFSKLR